MKNLLLFIFIITLSLSAQDGVLDASFGTNGIVTTDISTGEDRAFCSALQQDGKIVAAGRTRNGDFDIFVVRYNQNGSLDTSFGSNGFVTTDINPASDDIAYAIAAQTDGKIVVTGFYYNESGNQDVVIIRYNNDGALDNTFGTNGIVTTAVGTENESANAIIILENGKIIVTGGASIAGQNDLLLICYNSDGSLDNTFGTNGIVTTAVGSSHDMGMEMTEHDGKITIAARTHNGSNYDIALVRYNISGQLDTSFGSGGKTIIDIGNKEDEPRGIQIQTNGKIFVSGVTQNAQDYYDYAVICYEANGNIDTSFGSSGIITGNFGSDHCTCSGLSVSPNGKIILAGHYTNIGEKDIAITRYNSDGTIDTSFGTNGKITTNINGHDEIYCMLVQQNGKIVLTGTTQGYSLISVVRYSVSESIFLEIGALGTTSELPLYFTFNSKQDKVRVRVDWTNKENSRLRLRRQLPVSTRNTSKAAKLIDVTYRNVKAGIFSVILKHQGPFAGLPGSTETARSIVITISEYNELPSAIKITPWVGDPDTPSTMLINKLTLPATPSSIISEYPTGAIVTEEFQEAQWAWIMKDSTPELISYPALIEVTLPVKK